LHIVLVTRQLATCTLTSGASLFDTSRSNLATSLATLGKAGRGEVEEMEGKEARGWGWAEEKWRGDKMGREGRRSEGSGGWDGEGDRREEEMGAGKGRVPS